jgi:hypothetical protein
MKYMHELATSMGIDVIHMDAQKGTTITTPGHRGEPVVIAEQRHVDLPGEVEEPLICEWCDKPSPTLYPMYCTEVDPTQVDYLVCRHCANEIVGPTIYDLVDGKVPF